MTLLELAQLVCSRVNRTDAGALEAAKTYIKRRYEMIWNSRMWRDSVTVGKTYGMSRWRYSDDRPVVIGFHEKVDKVLLLWDSIKGISFDQSEMVDIARMNPGAFTEDTGAIGFVEMPRAGLSAPLTALNALGAVVLRVKAPNENDHGKTLVLSGTYNATIELSNNTVVSGLWTEVDSVGYEQCESSVRIECASSSSGSALWTDTTIPGSTSRSVARVRVLYPYSKSDSNGDNELGFVAKLVCPVLYYDHSSFVLRGIENALDAYATGDMLFRERKAATAQLKWAEGAQLVESLAKEEKSASSGARVIPEGELVAGGRDWLGY